MLMIRSVFVMFISMMMLNVSFIASADEESVYKLGEISVSTEQAQTSSATINSKQLYREQFEKAGMKDVTEALGMMPGISITSGTRNEKNIYVRGYDQRHIPIFMDGIPVSLPYDGYVDMGKIGLYSVGKIELQTGAPSVDFGANALGGAVNIVSRKPVKPFEAEMDLEYGRNNRFSSGLSLGTKQEKFYIAFSGNYEDSDGYMLSDNFHKTVKEDGDERENSDYLSKTANFKLGLTPTDKTEVSLGYNYIASERGIPHGVLDSSRYWRMTDWDKKTYYLIADTAFDHLKVRARVYRDEYYNVINSYDDDTYSTQLSRKAWESTYDDYAMGAVLGMTTDIIPGNTVSLTFQYRRDQHKSKGDSGEPWLKYEADTVYAGIEDAIVLNNKLLLTLGLAYDRNEPVHADNEDGTEGDDLRDSIHTFSPKAELLYTYSDETQLHASVAKTTRFPSLKDLYSTYIDGDYVENPDLEEEKAVNYEIGVKQALSSFVTLQANVFYSEIKDLITDGSVTIDGTVYDQKQNADKATYKGFEVFLNGTFMDINDVTLAYTYLDAKNESSDRDTDKLVDRPEHRLFLNHVLTLNKFYVSSNLTLQTSQYEENRGDWTEMGGMYLVDTKIGYNAMERVTVEAGIENLFDRDYSYSEGFPQEGRYWFTRLMIKI
ncbi:TonB-dependent receptor [Denitrovibrio acetiphilus DSM 12809]|uniref:TonB-dependent receptor n=1 Tax=Denitrovibrio acetiphilus (strain DSM 12809 / NBRC 114555 / N2460) TaxID=522772 RepID=D4H8L6_DENA2|nr:TonB-dependent receptor [Denitrovibrio acetiphilus]ADD68365.1 TonB-dependent receptor [Denitrovibrio acetiphilus DSM 12809]